MFCTQCGSNNSEEAKFCASCGRNMTLLNSDSKNKKNITSNDLENKNYKIIEYEKEVRFHIYGSIAKDVESKFSEVVNAKTFDDVRSNIRISKEFIMVTPHSRDRSNLVSFGLLGGPLGIIAAGFIAKLFSSHHDFSVKNSLQMIENILFLDATTLKVKAYDYRNSWDLGGGEWETRISIAGDGLFNGKAGDCTIVFAIPGKTYERTFFNKSNNKVPELCKILSLPVPDIKKETKFLW